MPPAKRKPAAKKPPAKKPAAKKPAAKKPAAKKPARAKTAPPRPGATAAPRVKPKPAQRSSKRTAAARSGEEAARDVAFFDSLAAVRDALGSQLVLTAERVQETLDEAVRLGRILPGDAQDLAERLGESGRRQVAELLAEIDRRLGRTR